MDNESLQLSWDYDLKNIRYSLIDKVGWGPDNDGDESWGSTEWRYLPEELQKALAPLIKNKIEEMNKD